ncbi:hypothetical protein K432DRAFT_387597 [Lepidopterella palustris CBS 459.81]|uniref:Uncharacterized protein n=1 Tax=Lepidopterella palustris CBS 459.81 TaxID=1314670 RepID=A0A8E2DWP5_9PEZI|nr:hypothetical protein K432DRAFT_387597 [Lepidopterella palustris CBS 459.81]
MLPSRLHSIDSPWPFPQLHPPPCPSFTQKVHSPAAPHATILWQGEEDPDEVAKGDFSR